MNLKEKIFNDKLYQILMKIKKKPGMFLKNADVNLLLTFILGYRQCEEINFIKREIDVFDIYNDGGFDLFVHNYYGIDTNHNWASIISFYNPTYSKDLDKFYELYLKYIEECIKKYES